MNTHARALPLSDAQRVLLLREAMHMRQSDERHSTLLDDFNVTRIAYSSSATHERCEHSKQPVPTHKFEQRRLYVSYAQKLNASTLEDATRIPHDSSLRPFDALSSEYERRAKKRARKQHFAKKRA